MTHVDVLEELKKFSIPERLTLVEAALRLIREDLQQAEQPLTQAERKHQLAAAAKALLPDYAAGGELTAFTALDSEDFYYNDARNHHSTGNCVEHQAITIQRRGNAE